MGYESPAALAEAGAQDVYDSAMARTFAAMRSLPDPGRQYLLPFGARSRFLFKMDFAEVEYIARVRSGVKGHFSYRDIAWQMKQRVDELEPELGTAAARHAAVGGRSAQALKRDFYRIFLGSSSYGKI